MALVVTQEKRSHVMGGGFEIVMSGTLAGDASFTIGPVPAHADKLFVEALCIATADGSVARATDIDHSAGTDTVTFGAAQTGRVYYRCVSSIRA